VVSSDPLDVDLDPDLEQQEDDPEVGEERELATIGDVAGRERRDREADGEVADDRREAGGPGDPPGEGRQEDDEPELEHSRCGELHSGMVRGRREVSEGRNFDGFRTSARVSSRFFEAQRSPKA
jgi:hypothetical protein